MDDFFRLSYSEPEVIDAALAFANLKGPLRLKKNWSVIKRLRIRRANVESPGRLNRAHRWINAALDAFSKKKPLAYRTVLTQRGKPLANSLEWGLADVRVVTVPVVRGAALANVEEGVVAGSIGGLCAYAAALIATGKQRRAKKSRHGYYRIQRCQWHECGKYFNAVSRGGRYPEYCDDECQNKKHGK